ncbi:putative importin alpha subunit [Paratrimastix pyriformis]|uniref:Importin alpha subunit n=1 Tax=Paratrimastix pyriformis TaxID=342808 RepID=A0ABQ8UNI7_9EUKA|nr:putative importin alpha subunit [Paratrimastix pyriformis]
MAGMSQMAAFQGVSPKGHAEGFRQVPIQVNGLPELEVKHLAAGDGFCVAMFENDEVYSWEFPLLANDSVKNPGDVLVMKVRLPPVGKVVQLGACGHSGFLLMDDGAVFSWDTPIAPASSTGDLDLRDLGCLRCAPALFCPGISPPAQVGRLVRLSLTASTDAAAPVLGLSETGTVLLFSQLFSTRGLTPVRVFLPPPALAAALANATPRPPPYAPGADQAERDFATRYAEKPLFPDHDDPSTFGIVEDSPIVEISQSLDQLVVRTAKGLVYTGRIWPALIPGLCPVERVALPPDQTAVRIAAGLHSLALTSNGFLYGWGLIGETHDESSDRPTFQLVSPSEPRFMTPPRSPHYATLSSASYPSREQWLPYGTHTLLLTFGRHVSGMGLSTAGQTALFKMYGWKPITIPDMEGVSLVATGASFSLVATCAQQTKLRLGLGTLFTRAEHCRQLLAAAPGPPKEAPPPPLAPSPPAMAEAATSGQGAPGAAVPPPPQTSGGALTALALLGEPDWFMDTELVGADKEPVHAHSWMLRARCPAMVPLLEAARQARREAADRAQIVLPMAGHGTLFCFLYYMYQDVIPWSASLVGDSIRVQAELVALARQFGLPRLEAMALTVFPPPPSSWEADIARLWENPQAMGADVSCASSSGQWQRWGHRGLLVLRSGLFSALLAHQSARSDTLRFDEAQYSWAVHQGLLEYIYRDRLTAFPRSQLVELVRAANYYQVLPSTTPTPPLTTQPAPFALVRALQHQAELLVARHVGPENLATLLSLADSLGLDTLREHCLYYLTATSRRLFCEMVPAAEWRRSVLRASAQPAALDIATKMDGKPTDGDGGNPDEEEDDARGRVQKELDRLAQSEVYTAGAWQLGWEVPWAQVPPDALWHTLRGVHSVPLPTLKPTCTNGPLEFDEPLAAAFVQSLATRQALPADLLDKLRLLRLPPRNILARMCMGLWDKLPIETQRALAEALFCQPQPALPAAAQGPPPDWAAGLLARLLALMAALDRLPLSPIVRRPLVESLLRLSRRAVADGGGCPGPLPPEVEALAAVMVDRPPQPASAADGELGTPGTGWAQCPTVLLQVNFAELWTEAAAKGEPVDPLMASTTLEGDAEKAAAWAELSEPLRAMIRRRHRRWRVHTAIYPEGLPGLCYLREKALSILSCDEEVSRTASQFVRRLLSQPKRPRYGEALMCNCDYTMLQLLRRDENPAIQYECLWALTNLSSGSPLHARAVEAAGSLVEFVRLTGSPDERVREQAVWAIGNVAGDNPHSRDRVIEAAMPALLRLANRPWEEHSRALLDNLAYAMTNLVRCPSVPPHPEAIRPVLPVFVRFARSYAPASEPPGKDGEAPRGSVGWEAFMDSISGIPFFPAHELASLDKDTLALVPSLFNKRPGPLCAARFFRRLSNGTAAQQTAALAIPGLAGFISHGDFSFLARCEVLAGLATLAAGPPDRVQWILHHRLWQMALDAPHNKQRFVTLLLSNLMGGCAGPSECYQKEVRQGLGHVWQELALAQAAHPPPPQPARAAQTPSPSSSPAESPLPPPIGRSPLAPPVEALATDPLHQFHPFREHPVVPALPCCGTPLGRPTPPQICEVALHGGLECLVENLSLKPPIALPALRAIRRALETTDAEEGLPGYLAALEAAVRRRRLPVEEVVPPEIWAPAMVEMMTATPEPLAPPALLPQGEDDDATPGEEGRRTRPRLEDTPPPPALPFPRPGPGSRILKGAYEGMQRITLIAFPSPVHSRNLPLFIERVLMQLARDYRPLVHQPPQAAMALARFARVGFGEGFPGALCTADQSLGCILANVHAPDYAPTQEDQVRLAEEVPFGLDDAAPETVEAGLVQCGPQPHPLLEEVVVQGLVLFHYFRALCALP